MTDNWQTFLNQQGAERDEQGVRRFANPGTGAGQLLALEHLGYLLVEGAEAKKFLQGQVTCDMQEVRQDQWQAGAHCNTKGRMLFSFRAVLLPSSQPGSDRLALIMHRGLLESARQALQKYIVFSKATLATGDEYQVLGLSGAAATGMLQSPPSTSQEVQQAETMLALNVGSERLLCLVQKEAAVDLWRQWATGTQLAGYPDWNLAEIREGTGQVMPGSEDMFIPQMLNMHITGGISFKKGCYIGQEVVARMQYLGKLKRHMRRFACPVPEVQAGAPLYSTESTQSVGNVVLSAPAGEEGELLAVTTDSAFENAYLYLDAEHSIQLQALPLPYEVK